MQLPLYNIISISNQLREILFKPESGIVAFNLIIVNKQFDVGVFMDPGF